MPPSPLLLNKIWPKNGQGKERKGGNNEVTRWCIHPIGWWDCSTFAGPGDHKIQYKNLAPPPCTADKSWPKNGQGKLATVKSPDGAFTLLVDEIAVIGDCLDTNTRDLVAGKNHRLHYFLDNIRIQNKNYAIATHKMPIRHMKKFII